MLTPSHKRFGKSLAWGGKLSIAAQCLSDLECRKHVAAGIGRVLQSELAVMCSKGFGSILCSTSPKNLKSFSWHQVVAETQACTPTLLHLLQSCMRTKRGFYKHKQKSIIGFLVSIMCKYQCQQMSLFQKMVSLVLYAGHSSKQVQIMACKGITNCYVIFFTIYHLTRYFQGYKS